MSKAQLISIAGNIPSTILPPAGGLVIWLGLENDTSEILTDPAISDRFAWSLAQALQKSVDGSATSVVAVWPFTRMKGSARDYASMVREIAIGIVQSAQLDFGSRGIRVNLILCHQDQIADVNRTLNYLHGMDGGFAAGATFDLREPVMETSA